MDTHSVVMNVSFLWTFSCCRRVLKTSTTVSIWGFVLLPLVARLPSPSVLFAVMVPWPRASTSATRLLALSRTRCFVTAASGAQFCSPDTTSFLSAPRRAWLSGYCVAVVSPGVRRLLLFGCDMSQQLSRTRVAPANSVFVCLIIASQICMYGLMVCCS